MITRKFIWWVMYTLFLLAGCSIQEPVLPTWQLMVQIPLSEKKIDIGKEIVNDSTIVVQGSDSLLAISFSGDVDGTQIQRKDLAIPPLDTSFSFTVDTIKLNNIQPIRTRSVNLRELFPQLEYMVGQTVTIPETTVVSVPLYVTAPEFKKIKVTKGILRLTVNNNLPFPLGPNSQTPEGFSLSVWNDSLNQVVTSVQIPEVMESGSSKQEWVNIGNGGWIYSDFRLEYKVPIAQQTTFTVTNELLDTAGFYIELKLESLEVTEAVAKIEPQHLNHSFDVPVNGDQRIQEAVVDEGFVVLNLDNQTPLAAHVVTKFPNLETATSQIFQDSLIIAPFSTLSHKIDLSNIRFANGNLESAYIDRIQLQIQSRTEGTSGYVHISSNDGVNVQVSSDSIYFSSFTGYISPDTLNLAPIEQHHLADYGGLSDGVFLKNAVLTLTLFNEIYVENLFLNYRIRGYHKDDNGVVTDSADIVLLNQQINPGQPGNPGTTTIQLSGEQVTHFLNILPTDLRGFGKVNYGGTAQVIPGARVWGSYDFSTPLSIIVSNAAPIFADVQTLTDQDIDSDFQKAADDQIGEAALQLNVQNHTPLGGQIRLIVSADSNHTDIYDKNYFNPELEFEKIISLQPAPTDANGFVVQSESNTIQLNLTNKEIRLFKHTPLRIGYEIQIADTQGPVFLRANDFVTISGVASAAVWVGKK